MLLIRLLIVFGLVVITWVSATIAGSHPARQPVYSVAQVRLGLEEQPRRWLGRTVLVRGVAEGCDYPPGLDASCQLPSLVDAAPAPAVEPLPVLLQLQRPELAFLRLVPLLDRLLPPVQHVRWGEVTRYRILLQTAPGASCGDPQCYRAILLDAALIPL